MGKAAVFPVRVFTLHLGFLATQQPWSWGLGFVFVACSVSGLSVKMYTVRWNGLAGDIYIRAVCLWLSLTFPTLLCALDEGWTHLEHWGVFVFVCPFRAKWAFGLCG